MILPQMLDLLMMIFSSHKLRLFRQRSHQLTFSNTVPCEIGFRSESDRKVKKQIRKSGVNYRLSTTTKDNKFDCVKDVPYTFIIVKGTGTRGYNSDSTAPTTLKCQQVAISPVLKGFQQVHKLLVPNGEELINPI